MEITSWSQRLKATMQKEGLSKAELSRRTGINYDSINKYVRGEVDNPRGDIFERLSHGLGCKVEWLVFGTHEQETISTVSLPENRLGFFGDVRAGAWLEVNALHEPSYEHMPVLPDKRFNTHDQFAVRVVGDSMDKVFAPGTFLICVSLPSLGREPKENDYVIAEKTMNGLKEVTVKKFCLEAGQVLLKPESSNPVHKPIRYSRGSKPVDDIQLDQVDVSIIALVVGEYRQL